MYTRGGSICRKYHRYIENIIDISPISIDQYRYRIGTLDIGFFDISISYC